MNHIKWKRLISAFLVVLLTVTSLNFGTVGNAEAKTESLTLHYASESNTGAISEFGSSYNHGRVMYGVIDGNAAYCMNFGKAVDGGQSMQSGSNMETPLSSSGQRQLLYCMYYGHARKGSSAPSIKERNEFIATQAMIWVITEGLWGKASADNAAKKICDSAPGASDSNSYYKSLKKKMEDALNQSIPSFTKNNAPSADTIELQWNEGNKRFEKTFTDSNKVLKLRT